VGDGAAGQELGVVGVGDDDHRPLRIHGNHSCDGKVENVLLVLS
jgi:hypothetical protein